LPARPSAVSVGGASSLLNPPTQRFDTAYIRNNMRPPSSASVPRPSGKPQAAQMGSPIPSRTMPDVLQSFDQSGVWKAVIPEWLYKPVFGKPRNVNLPELRRLSKTPHIAMCMPAGSDIYLGDGKIKNIEDIKVGDMVLTHKGEQKKVIELMNRNITEEIIEFKTYGYSEPICLTKEHPILTIKADKCINNRHYFRCWNCNAKGCPNKESSWNLKPEWVNAGELTERDIILFPITKSNERDIQTINIEGKELPVSENLMNVLGSYIAEGYSQASGIKFGFGKNDEDVVENITEALYELGYSPKETRKAPVIEIAINSYSLSRYIKSNFGGTGLEKHLPEWVINLPSEKLIHLIKYYFYGDGCDSGRLVKVSSVSQRLIFQLRDILLRMGIFGSISKLDRKGTTIKIEGRTVNRNDLYELVFTGHDKALFKKIILGEDEPDTYNKFKFVDAAYAYLAVKEINKIQYNGKVYNFEVEDNNSYCTPYHIVHNCINTIINETTSIPWEIVPKDGCEDTEVQGIEEVTEFLTDPNPNKESFKLMLRQLVQDVLEIDAGVMIKIFTYDSYYEDEETGMWFLKPLGQRKLSALKVYDGVNFTVNPDSYGILPEQLAYWQYSWATYQRPTFFGRDEVIYFSQYPQSQNAPYGRSPVEILGDIAQSLLYSITWQKEFYDSNTIPPGIISLLEANGEQIKAFRDRWDRFLMRNDEFGNTRRYFHKTPVTNQDVKWTPITLPEKDLRVLESQEWWLKLVMATFNVTPSEMGITDDVNRATDLSQGEVFKRKAIKPILDLLEFHINTEIIPEFGYDDIEFKFVQKDLVEDRRRKEIAWQEIRLGVKSKDEYRAEFGETAEEKTPLPENEAASPYPNEGIGGQIGQGLDEAYSELSPNDDDPRPPPGFRSWRDAFEEWENEIKAHRDSTGANRELSSHADASHIHGAKCSCNKALTTTTGSVGTTGNALIPVYLTADLGKLISEWLDDRMNSILSDVDNQTDVDKKALDLNVLKAVISRLQSFLTPSEMVKLGISEVARKAFMEGHGSAEKALNMNINVNEKMLQMAQDMTLNDVKGMTDEIAKSLRLELYDSFQKGENLKDLTARIKNTFSGIVESRAKMIAVTTVTKVWNEASIESYKESGVVEKVEWMSRQDDKVCPVCLKFERGSPYKLETAPRPAIDTHPNSYDKDTEVYTKDGWTKVSDIVIGDNCLSLNPDTFDLEYSDVIKTYKHKPGEMIHFINRVTDLKVTKDHNIFFQKKVDFDRKNNKWGFVKAQELMNLKNGKMFRSSKWKGTSLGATKLGGKLVDAETYAEFMGWFLSEGSVNPKAYEVNIAQSKSCNYENWCAIDELLQRIGFNYRARDTGFYIKDSNLNEQLQVFGKSYEKFIPDEIKNAKPETIQKFLDVYNLGDGSSRKPHQWKEGNFKNEREYFTVSKRLADDLGELLIKVGRRPSYYLDKAKGKIVHHHNGDYAGNFDLWRIRECYGQYLNLSRLQKKIVPYSDYAYCVDLRKNHTLLTRRNGKVVWSGNCRCRIIPHREY